MLPRVNVRPLLSGTFAADETLTCCDFVGASTLAPRTNSPHQRQRGVLRRLNLHGESPRINSAQEATQRPQEETAAAARYRNSSSSHHVYMHLLVLESQPYVDSAISTVN